MSSLKLLRWVLALALLGALAPGSALAAPQRLCNVPITMSDGVVLRANVYLPPQGGRVPTVLTATGYNKDGNGPPYCEPGGGNGGEDPDLIAAGYAVMVLDERGTGASGGQWDSWGERTQQDYREVLDWIQRQPWANGSVGNYGGSYGAIAALLVAEADAQRVAQGKRRAVKAVWGEVPMADAYRDVTFHGGSVNAGFIPLWLGLTTAYSDIPPSTLVSDPASALDTYPGHLANTFQFSGQKLLSFATGGDDAYDGPFYRLRSPVTRLASLRIPVAWTGGWWDIFQRGQPLLYERMVNSPHKLWFQEPRYHAPPDASVWKQLGLGTKQQVVRRWFDRWLKGTRNGIEELPEVNLHTMGTNRWQHRSTWPLPGTRYTRHYLGADKTLSTGKSGSAAGDTAPLLAASSPCSRLTAQWTAGIVPTGSCQTDNSTYEATALTYTTKPLAADTEVTGLITADLWAKLSSRDATLVAVLSDVAPSGKSTQLTAGFLLASQRAVDAGRSTKGPGGLIVRPWHPFTKASQKPVPANEPQRYLVEVYPTSNVFRKGHRIRLTIGTANTPSTVNPIPDQLNQAGGEITLLRGGAHASSLVLPTIARSAVTGRADCLAQRAPIGPRNIGRVRLGYTRAQLLRRAPAPRRRTKRAWRWCVKRSTGAVRAAFSRRGRVALVATTGARHGNRRVHPGSRISRLRSAYPRRRHVARGLFRANARSPRLIGVRRGRVRFIAVAPPKLIRKRRALRSYLRLAGLR